MSRPAHPSIAAVMVLLGAAGCLRTNVFAITDQTSLDAGLTDAGSDLLAAGADRVGVGIPDAGSDPPATGADRADVSRDLAHVAKDAIDLAPSEDTAQARCPSAVLPAGDTTATLKVGTTSRSYVLHVPPAYDGTKPSPLILDFHAIGNSGATELTSSPYPAVTDSEGVVMAFPDGLPGPAGTGWNVGPCCVADVDDVAFARAVVADIQRTACIDSVRVYAVGVSTGGGMAHYLGCHAADIFAAVAPAAFDLLGENVGDCSPARPITVITFRGTADAKVPYIGGDSTLVPRMPVTFLGAQATFENWAEIDGCTGTPSDDSNGCSAYANCQGGVEVILCTKQGGRQEPGDPTLAWPVLSRHHL